MFPSHDQGPLDLETVLTPEEPELGSRPTTEPAVEIPPASAAEDYHYADDRHRIGTMAETLTGFWAAVVDRSFRIGDLFRRWPKTMAMNFGRVMIIRSNLPMRYETRDVRCVALIGGTGVGKTSLIYDLFPHDNIARAWVTSTGVWYDGYTDQEILLIDDIRRAPESNAVAGYSEQELLNVTDLYRYSLPIKSSFALANYRLVVFTSNVPIWKWLSDDADTATLLALQRRIKSIRCTSSKTDIARAFFEYLTEHPNEGKDIDHAGFQWTGFLRAAGGRALCAEWYDGNPIRAGGAIFRRSLGTPRWAHTTEPCFYPGEHPGSRRKRSDDGSTSGGELQLAPERCQEDPERSGSNHGVVERAYSGRSNGDQEQAEEDCGRSVGGSEDGGYGDCSPTEEA